MTKQKLQDQAEDFAQNLSSLAKCVSEVASPFEAVLVPERGTGNFRCTINQQGTNGIPLKVGTETLLVVTAKYTCILDHEKEFLAVHSSSFKVYAKEANGEPLFRWDFLREPGEQSIPSAHMHVQAHRDAATYVMVKAGKDSKRVKNRSRSGMPKMSQLHFPLGGSRFRPCLEDLLEGLIYEFGISHDDALLDRLAEGRYGWRIKQLKAAIRDAPYEAVESLESLGYKITPPVELPKANVERFRRI